MLDSSSPIGIFDSGIGGLSIARAIVDTLPQENIIYFGDTLHLPYGEKSADVIKTYAVRIAQLLIEKQCKMIVIACNSASSAGFDAVKETVGSKAIVVDVIKPVTSHTAIHLPQKHIGIIGTKQTINSQIYFEQFQKHSPLIKVTSHPTPMLALAIEENLNNSIIITDLLKQYLLTPTLKDIDALILGCTHYPAIKQHFIDFYRNKVEIIDSPNIVASEVKKALEENNLCNKIERPQQHRFMVSDLTQSFIKHSKIFFGEQVMLEHYPLWEEQS